MGLLLGIDVGTSATKAVLCDDAGRVIAVGSSEHPTSRPHPGWSEQDPLDWWSSCTRAVRAALADAGRSGADVAAVGLSGQMHGSVFLPRESLADRGRSGRTLRPALLWNDQRTADECRLIEHAAGGRRRLVERAGNAALTGFTLPKILWLKRHEPDAFARLAAVCLPKDYVRLRLTGELATDAGDASGVLLLDPASRAWNTDLARDVGIDPALLPRVLESAERAGLVTPWAAEQIGLRPGTPVVAGSGDNQAGAVGAGVVSPGMVLCTIGTSGVIYAHADRPRADLPADPSLSPGRVHTMCAATGDARARSGWCITGCTLAAGGSLQWCRDTLAPGTPFDHLLAEAADAPRASAGLVFLPYLTGERCPHPDPLARGAWIGLTARHTRAHLVRAVTEGICFTLADILAIVRSIGVPVSRVRVGGGGSRSVFWRQMLADIFALPVATTNTEQGPAYGAALLAGVGAGVWPDVPSACAACVREGELHEPDPRAADLYAAARAVHARLYHDLRDRFAQLHAADRLSASPAPPATAAPPGPATRTPPATP